VVEAARFQSQLKKNSKLKPKSTWDGSIISFLNYPQIVTMMSEDLDWTQSLGAALTYQQKDVLIAIQQLRDKAVADNIIKSDDKIKAAVGIMVLLMVITVLYLPIVLPMPLPGVTVWTHGGSHARSSCSCFFPSRLDSFSTLGTRAWPTGSNPWPASYPILALVAMIELIVITNFDKILDVFGTRAILAGLVFISSGFGNSWLLIGSNTGIGRVLALGTAQRNIAAALVVASQNFDDPKVAVIVIVVSIVGLLLLLPLARALVKR